MRTYLTRTTMLLITLAMTLPVLANAQGSPQHLGVIPADAVVAGHVRVAELMDLDRLQRLMNSWGAVLGDQADGLIAQMTDEYNSDLAPFATNVSSCLMYTRSFANDGPVTLCEGNFGEGGYTPPDYSEVEVVDGGVMVTGAHRAEATAQLGSTGGGATVAGVALDPSLLAHVVVRLPPEAAAMAGASPVPIEAIQHIELRIAQDDTQLGSLSVEVRIATNSAAAAQSFQALATMMSAELPPEAIAIGITADDVGTWVQLDGNTVVIRVPTEVLATGSAIAIPMFLEQVNSIQDQAIQVQTP